MFESKGGFPSIFEGRCGFELRCPYTVKISCDHDILRRAEAVTVRHEHDKGDRVNYFHPRMPPYLLRIVQLKEQRLWTSVRIRLDERWNAARDRYMAKHAALFE